MLAWVHMRIYLGFNNNQVSSSNYSRGLSLSDQSEASIEVTWPLLTNERPVLESRFLSSCQRWQQRSEAVFNHWLSRGSLGHLVSARSATDITQGAVHKCWQALQKRCLNLTKPKNYRKGVTGYVRIPDCNLSGLSGLAMNVDKLYRGHSLYYKSINNKLSPPWCS